MSNAVKQAKALGAGARPTLLNNILASLEEDLRPYYLGRAWLSSALAIAMLATGVLTYILPSDSFFYLLSAEVFGGLTTFVLFLLLSTLIVERWISLALALAMALAVAAAAAAFVLDGTTRELLLALSVGIMLAVALDYGVKSLFKSIQRAIAVRHDLAYDEVALGLAQGAALKTSKLPPVQSSVPNPAHSSIAAPSPTKVPAPPGSGVPPAPSSP